MLRRSFLKALGGALALPSVALAWMQKTRLAPPMKAGVERNLNKYMSEYFQKFGRHVAEIEAKAFYP
jgi:hypothetical protein